MNKIASPFRGARATLFVAAALEQFNKWWNQIGLVGRALRARRGGQWGVRPTKGSLLNAISLSVCLLFSLRALAGGIWTPLATQPPETVGTMLLLSDGTVMAEGGGGDNPSVNWYRLTPDTTSGSYVNGSWTTRHPMNYSRVYFSSDVLPSGDVFVCGAEYGSGTTNAELYNPFNDTWSIIPIPSGIITTNNSINTKNHNENTRGLLDSGSVVLSTGEVLVEPVFPATSGDTAVYNPADGSWVNAPLQNGGDEDEASTVKLPDDSILVVDSGAQTAERFIPSEGQWILDNSAPVNLYDIYGGEEGPAFLLPNGNAFFIGSSPVTAIYIPSGNNSPGTWKKGPSLSFSVGNLGAPDAPAAMMPNGNILCALSPTPFVMGTNTNVFTSPTYFYEYNYSSGSIGAFTPTTSPTGGASENTITYPMRMLDLPDGGVLFSDGGTVYEYTPTNGAPLASGQPVINNVSWNGYGTLQISGVLFNGNSQGAAYGDDAQMDSNYPLVRFTGNGGVYYGTTYNWTSTSVQSGNTVTTQVILPSAVLSNPGLYSLQVVANGNASAGVGFYGPIWVDFNYNGATQNGSFANPYKSMAGGLGAVTSGGAININGAVQPSTSSETPSITTAMSIYAISGPSTIGN